MGIKKRREVTLPPRVAFWAVCSMLALAMCASGAPSPLYHVYQTRWGFSTFDLTVIYAVYPVTVLLALLLAGGTSDRVGRRPVLVTGLLGLMTSALVFLASTSAVSLVAARAVQGLSTGILLGAVGAAMLDLRGARSGERIGMLNGSLTGLGIGAGALGTALLVAYAPDGSRAAFVVLLVAEAILVVFAFMLPETVVAVPSARWCPRVPRVPRPIRPHFAFSALGVVAAWSVMGLFLALGPSLAGELAGGSGSLAGGVAIAIVVGTATLAEIAMRRLDARSVTVIGALSLAVGVTLNAAILEWNDSVIFYVTCAGIGVGFGPAYYGALRSLSRVIPVTLRAEVMSAFYVVAYVASSLPALAAGIAATRVDLFTTFQIFACAVVLVCLAATALARTARAT